MCRPSHCLAVTGKPEPKRRAAEAEAATKFVGTDDPADAKRVMSVVIGVLKYENKVNEDLQKLMNEKDAEAAKRADELKANDAEIARLQAEIRKIEDENVALEDAGHDANALVADKAKVAALFTS